MHGKLLAAILTASLFTAPALAETDPEPPAPQATWTVQVDPLTIALGFVHVQIERRLGDQVSVYLGPNARLWDLNLKDDDPSYYGIGAEAGVRWYFRGGAPAGWWALARGVLAHLRADNEDTDLGWYASALVGYTWIFKGRWVLAAGLGVQYLDYTVSGVGTDGILPAAHTAAGFAF